VCQLEASDSLGNGPMKAPFSCPNNSDSSSPAGWQPVSPTYARAAIFSKDSATWPLVSSSSCARGRQTPDLSIPA